MVIVEYCPFGNLQSCLVKNRRNFVNQIVPGTDEINVKLAPMDFPTNSKFQSVNRYSQLHHIDFKSKYFFL